MLPQSHGGLVGTLKRLEAGKYNYIFDLSRRPEGLLVARRVTEMPETPASQAHWLCTADDDADAVSRALRAAQFEWPSLPGRPRNDFIVKFIQADGSGD